MASLNKLTPAAFAKSHRTLVEEVVAPAARQLGAKALSTPLSEDLFRRRDEPAVKVVIDNLKPLSDAARRAIPLKEVYELTESNALSAASAAAKSTGGVLTPESARFLPQAFQLDYQTITGLKVSDRPGAAVDGVHIESNGNQVKVDIEFQKALAGQTAAQVVLGLTDQVMIIAERREPPADPALPPYWVFISPREGKLPAGTTIRTDTGTSGFGDVTAGHLINAGTSAHQLLGPGDRPLQTLTFSLDQVNGIGVAQKPASEKTRVVREAWDSHFSADVGGFDFAAALKKGSLVPVTRDALEAMAGAKTMLSAIRERGGASITRLIADERVQLVRDPATRSTAVLLTTEGESDSRLFVLDEKSQRWVGSIAVGDDGTHAWQER